MTDSFHIVFLTCGESYIFSHTYAEFLNAEVVVTVFDIFCNSEPLIFPRVAQITGKKLTLVQADIIHERATFGTALHPSGASEAMHFAGLK